MVLEPFDSADAVQAWFDSNGSNNFEAVATVDNTAIGFAGLFPCRGAQSHAGSLSLFVHDEFQGRGIGALMMTAIVATADILASPRPQLTVFCDNERAISLYRKFGFEIEGRHEGFARRDNELLATFTMASSRDPASGSSPFDMERLQNANCARLYLFPAPEWLGFNFKNNEMDFKKTATGRVSSLATPIASISSTAARRYLKR